MWAFKGNFLNLKQFMKKFKTIVLCLLTVCAAAGLNACSDDDENATGNAGDFTPEITISINDAGTLSENISKSDIGKAGNIKITGELNGTDIIFIRERAGSRGKALMLDLSGARIVNGGEMYYAVDTTEYVTANDTIGDYMFTGCKALEGIILPDGTAMGRDVFSGCERLRYVTLPAGLTGVGAYTFASCTSLTAVDIPDGATKIGDGAFGGCTALKDIHLPNSVDSIGKDAFNSCTAMTSIKLPDAVYFIGNGAFWNCTRLKNISIPARVENIGADAFNYCINLEAADIPDNVKEIGDRAFRSCNKLAAVTLPTALKTIGDEAFAYCTMFSEITIPADVKSLGVSTDRYGNYVTCPFIGCDNLRTIYMRCAEAPEGLAPTLWLLSQDCGAAVKVYVPRGASAGYAKQLDDFRNDHGVSGTIAEFEEYDL